MAGQQEIPEGSVAAGRRAKLPRGAEQPVRVYVNGVEQTPGADYELRGGELVFSRQIVKEGKLGGIRWLSMFLGVAGSYRKHETVDVEYRVDGRPKLMSDVEMLGD
ncbi:MAG: hypothetical protein H0W09_04275 [Solirubrobacterales bacterium]|nr:hypothetical protein [Solirubrobacterales bacterium]